MTVFWLLIITVVVWGVAPIIDKLAVKNTSPFLGNIFRSITITFAMLVITLFSGELKDLLKMPHKNIVYYIISGLLAGGIGVVAYYKMLQLAPTSKVVPLAATYPLVTAILSMLFLSEKVTPERFVGIVLIVSGIYLVK
ncbi:MAG: EamA family transporter [Endomicrobiia bacterium]|nr:EamA family transporter [Endomicrobiia bacterium]